MAYSKDNHPAIDDPRFFVFYRYAPSLAAAIIFIICFAITSFIHIWQARRYRSSFFIPLIVGGFFEFGGYIGRALSAALDQWLLAYYIVQATLLLVAPALFAASIYMILGRIISLVDGEHHSMIRQKWLTKAFVCGDCISFLVQAAGAGIMATSAMTTGEKMVIVGLAVQVFSFGLFVVVSVVFHYRILKSPTLKSAKDSGINWQKHMYVLYTASALIFVRSVFRVIEYAMGNAGYLLTNEVFLYVFDSVLMLGTMVVFNVIHPGQITRDTKREEILEMDENSISN